MFNLSISTEAILEYQTFYRRFGVRRVDILTKPQVFKSSLLTLPRSSLLHYVDDSGLTTGPVLSDPIYREVTKVILVEHITQLVQSRAGARPVVKPLATMIRDYHIKNKKARPLRSLDTVEKDPLTLVVENYALLPQTHRYITSVFSNYNRWWNIQATVWSNVERLGSETDRNQYLFIELPKRFPTLELFKIKEKQTDITRRVIDDAPESNAWFLLEFWKWLGVNREGSLLSVLSDDTLEKVNIVWQESGMWFTVNLGLLNQWRMDNLDKDPSVVQRRWLRSMTHLLSFRSVMTDAEEEKEEVSEDTERDPTEEDNFGKVDDQDDIDLTQPELEEPEIQEIELPPTVNVDKDDSIEDTEVFVSAVVEDDEIGRVEDLSEEDDLRELEEMTTVSLDTNKLSYSRHVSKAITPVEGIIKVADQMAGAGLIMASDYRKIIDNANKFERIPDPFGSGKSIAEAMTITSEDLKIDSSKTSMGDIKGVGDKSMLQSSLMEFSPKYINEVLNKDILQSVIGLQKAGIIIQDYKVDRVETLNDDYSIHTIKLMPVVGAPSTIKLKVPNISKDGKILARGVLYSNRLQFSDIPIRKVSPNRVALTSYYSKLFIERSERKVNNYPNWIINQIWNIGLDTNDNRITDMKLSNVFDHTLRLPRIYSILGTKFSGFKSNDIVFNFEYNKRYERWGEELKSVEENGFYVVGKTGSDWIFVDEKNAFYSFGSNGTKTELGTIEDILKLDKDKAPMEYAEIGILGKGIPLGFVLARLMGLGKLLTTLNAEVRREPVSRLVNLSDDEYAIRFSDSYLVIKKGNPIVDLLMTGFSRYKDEIRKFTLYHFDKTEVYDIVLERNELGARYGREVNTLNDMWVDHITLDILRELKEPEDFIGLLLRATELLTTDWHPAPTDMRYMRCRGFERIAGNIYTELSKAVRVYKSRPPSKSISLSINPEAIWMSTLSDPALLTTQQSNPIHNLKEKEYVIFGGTGGRSSRSMTGQNRRFHKSNLGVVSESTVDNSDTGTILVLTADPKFSSLRGMSNPLEEGKDGPATTISTNMLLMPGLDRDDQLVLFMSNYE